MKILAYLYPLVGGSIVGTFAGALLARLFA
jgi:hypothetical protein